MAAMMATFILARKRLDCGFKGNVGGHDYGNYSAATFGEMLLAEMIIYPKEDV
jgi:hypothetical protein